MNNTYIDPPQYSGNNTTRKIIKYLHQTQTRHSASPKITASSGTSTSEYVKPFDFYETNIGSYAGNTTNFMDFSLYYGIGEQYSINIGGGFAAPRIDGTTQPTPTKEISSEMDTFITSINLDGRLFGYKEADESKDIPEVYYKQIVTSEITEPELSIYIFLGISRTYGSFIFWVKEIDGALDKSFINDECIFLPLYRFDFEKVSPATTYDLAEQYDLRNNYTLSLMV